MSGRTGDLQCSNTANVFWVFFALVPRMIDTWKSDTHTQTHAHTPCGGFKKRRTACHHLSAHTCQSRMLGCSATASLCMHTRTSLQTEGNFQHTPNSNDLRSQTIRHTQTHTNFLTLTRSLALAHIQRIQRVTHVQQVFAQITQARSHIITNTQNSHIHASTFVLYVCVHACVCIYSTCIQIHKSTLRYTPTHTNNRHTFVHVCSSKASLTSVTFSFRQQTLRNAAHAFICFCFNNDITIITCITTSSFAFPRRRLYNILYPTPPRKAKRGNWLQVFLYIHTIRPIWH